MLLVDKKRIASKRLDSGIVVTACEEDAELVADLTRRFAVLGINYVFLSKPKDSMHDYWYWRACEECLRAATIMVIVMTERFFSEEDGERRETCWYEVGAMDAKGYGVIPYFVGIPQSKWDDYLSRTPIRQTQATGDLDELIAEIERRRAFRRTFFTSGETAAFANPRIFYTEQTVLFSVPGSVPDAIVERMKLMDDEEIVERSDAVALLQRELNFGVRLHRFGRREFVDHPYYRPYKAEAVVQNTDVAAGGNTNRFSLISINVNKSAFVIKVTFVMPNHEVLGVSYKPYIEIDKSSPVLLSDAMDLLTLSAGGEDNIRHSDIVTADNGDKQRIYFNLYFDGEGMIVDTAGEDEEIGKTCNFVYPK